MFLRIFNPQDLIEWSSAYQPSQIIKVKRIRFYNPLYAIQFLNNASLFFAALFEYIYYSEIEWLAVMQFDHHQQILFSEFDVFFDFQKEISMNSELNLSLFFLVMQINYSIWTEERRITRIINHNDPLVPLNGTDSKPNGVWRICCLEVSQQQSQKALTFSICLDFDIIIILAGLDLLKGSHLESSSTQRTLQPQVLDSCSRSQRKGDHKIGA